MPAGLARSIEHFRLLHQLKVVNRSELAVLTAFSTVTVVFEVVGMAMLFPILKYLEAGKNVEVFVSKSRVNGWIAEMLGVVGLPINLASLSCVAFALILVRQMVNYFHGQNLELVKLRIGKRIALGCFSTILGARSRYLQGMKAGEFALLCDAEAQSVASIVRVYAVLWMIALTTLAYSWVMIVAQPVASLLALAVLVGISGLMGGLIKKTRSASEDMLAYRRYFVEFLTERFRAWKLLKIGDSLDRELDLARKITHRSLNKQMHIQRLAAAGRLIFVPLIMGFVFFSLYWATEVLHMDLAEITLFVIVVVRLMPVVQQANTQFNLLARFDPSLARIAQVVREASEAADPAGGDRVLSSLKTGISLSGIRFAYPGNDRSALNGVSLNIPAGKLTAIVGASGSGKTTLMDLIPRLIEPAEGQVLFDGIPIEDFSLRLLRRSITLVTQQPLLFDATVAENIGYLKPAAGKQEIKDAAKLAFAHEFIMQMPNGYDTYVGDDGARLSGGQRQRLMLARAFLSDALIVLLDEPTSALDYEAERQVQIAIETLVRKKGTTVVVIAHRLSTVRNADVVIRMSAGRVDRIGSPQEVLPSIGAEDFSSPQIGAVV